MAGQREEVEIVPEMGESRFVPDFCFEPGFRGFPGRGFRGGRGGFQGRSNNCDEEEWHGEDNEGWNNEGKNEWDENCPWEEEPQDDFNEQREWGSKGERMSSGDQFERGRKEDNDQPGRSILDPEAERNMKLDNFDKMFSTWTETYEKWKIENHNNPDEEFVQNYTIQNLDVKSRSGRSCLCSRLR